MLDDPLGPEPRLPGGFEFCWNTTNSSPPKRATKSSGAWRGAGRRDRAQQLVAARMTQGIVDLAELVEVDEQQRRQLLGIVPYGCQAADLVAEMTRLGKRGQS